MMRICFFVALSLVLLNTSRANAGGTVGTGGDAIVASFTAYARILQGLIKGDLRELFPEVDAKKFEFAIEKTKVLVLDKLILDGLEKDAITNVSEATIQISRKRWPQVMGYSIQSRYQLVFHEYLHLLHIEDKKYEISSRLQALNETIFISGYFAPLTDVAPSSEYLRFFDEFSQPRFNYSGALKGRFGDQLNRAIYADQLSSAERAKSHKIYRELSKAADRGRYTKRSYLLIDNKEAERRAKEFEQNGTLSDDGAWSIALATAKLHNFAGVVHGEFMSELIREAYGRSGYRITDDFNTSRGNELIWSTTASVNGLSEALFKAGWIPWDSAKYRPVVGAVAFLEAGKSPGHCWAVAGQDGRWIVDVGNPQGRDLGQTAEKSIQMMYRGGVFFLPPGILPNYW